MTKSLDTFNNDAFDAWFALVHDCRKGGNLDPVDTVLHACSIAPEIFTVDMMLAILRLTYSIRDHLPHWNVAFDSVREELENRGKDFNALLHGIFPTSEPWKENRDTYKQYLKEWGPGAKNPYIGDMEECTLQAMEYAAALAIGCKIDPLSSRCCQRGTRGCALEHSKESK